MMEATRPKSTIIRFVLFLLLASFAGAWIGVKTFPMYLPGIVQSLAGTDPKVYWYLSRAMAISSYGILWLSMILGLMLSSRMAKTWPGMALASDIHQFVSILGLASGIFHGLLLMGDHYIQFTFFQVILPFANTTYKPLWVGLGQLAFYGWLLLLFSYSIRRWIGRKAWRWIHYASFITYVLVLVHSIASGSDLSASWLQAGYWFSGAIFLFLLVYRLLARWSASPKATVKD